MSNCLKLEVTTSLTCGICGKLYEEPRILPCLHTFCTKCIEGLDTHMPLLAVPTKCSSNPQQKNLSLSSNKDSATSGYESGKSTVSSQNSLDATRTLNNTKTTTLLRGRIIQCPTCDTRSDMPKDGAVCLPLHYVLQHKLLQFSLSGALPNECERHRIFCDLCIGEVLAVSWCPECFVSLCAFCVEAHKRQRRTKGHGVCLLSDAVRLGLVDVLAKASQTKRSHCSPVCPSHPTEELSLFCETCKRTICKDCSMVGDHDSHSFCPVSEVAEEKVHELSTLLEQSLAKAESLRKGLTDVRATARQIEIRRNEVTSEVVTNISSYIKALEEHRQNLLDKVKKACEVKQRILQLQSIHLEQALEDFETLCSFIGQLRDDGSHIEIVSLLGHVSKRLHDLECEKHRLEPRVDSFLQFIPNESNGLVNGFAINGVVTAQRICPQKCTLKGLPVVRQGRKVDVLLLTRDTEGQPMRRGGFCPKIELTSKEVDSRVHSIKATDRKDGTYQFSIRVENPGLFWLNIKINDQHIQGSPFPLPVKANKGPVHCGIYHCCTFCSSGGSKEATCACGGTMPGGFKGCGHNHDGHPGQRHWSCCGKTIEKSGCSRPSERIVQVTL